MLATVDAVLRGTGPFASGRGRVPWRSLGLVLAASGFLYGLTLGSFSLSGRQALYSGLKVPLLLVATTLVCLPSYFVVNSVLGLRDDFAAAFRGVLAAQASVAVCLAALGPAVLFAYASSDSYRFALFINGLYFAIAAVAGQRSLDRHYRPLVARHRQHNVARFMWLAMYVFVAIQLAWVLRPFVGRPGLETRFFREDAWSNAYVFIVRKVLGVNLFGY